MKCQSILLGICFVVLYDNGINGQSIKVGEPIPDLVLKQTWNFKDTVISIKDIRKKLIILDFWGFNCAGCLHAFPKMDSLQKKYDSEIQIVMVNQESREATAGLFRKRKQIFKPALPFITSDTILWRLFPHIGNPYHVWLDEHHVVISKTWGNYTSDEAIAAYLRTGKRQKMSESNWESVRSLIKEQYQPGLLYSSFIRKCDTRITISSPANNKGQRSITYNCETIPQLFAYAFNEGQLEGYERPGRLKYIIDDSRPDLLYTNSDSNFTYGRYSYQIQISGDSLSALFQIMRSELMNVFQLNASVEQMPVKSLVLVRVTPDDNLKSKGGNPFSNFFRTSIRSDTYDSIRSIRNMPFSYFAKRLGNWVDNQLRQPFIDSTDYTGNIDIDFDGKVVDTPTLQSFRSELSRYGLDLVEKTCNIPVLVIRNKRGKN